MIPDVTLAEFCFIAVHETAREAARRGRIGE